MEANDGHGHGHTGLGKLLPKSLSTRRKHRSKSKTKRDDAPDPDAAALDDQLHDVESEQRGRRLSVRSRKNSSADGDDADSALFDNDGDNAETKSFVSTESSTDVDGILYDS
jgi:hypothetical protein